MIPEVENDNQLQYPCLENPMERRAWQATQRVVHHAEHTHTHTHTHRLAGVNFILHGYRNTLQWFTYQPE